MKRNFCNILLTSSDLLSDCNIIGWPNVENISDNFFPTSDACLDFTALRSTNLEKTSTITRTNEFPSSDRGNRTINSNGYSLARIAD